MAAAVVAGREIFFLPRQNLFLIKQADGSVWGLEADRRNRMIRFRGAAAAFISLPHRYEGNGEYRIMLKSTKSPDRTMRPCEKNHGERSCL